MQNIYDDPEFFARYSEMRNAGRGLHPLYLATASDRGFAETPSGRRRTSCTHTRSRESGVRARRAAAPTA